MWPREDCDLGEHEAFVLAADSRAAADEVWVAGGDVASTGAVSPDESYYFAGAGDARGAARPDEASISRAA